MLMAHPILTGVMCIRLSSDLLETTKPFLVNTIRVPAFPILLLNAREIDTNDDITRCVYNTSVRTRLSWPIRPKIMNIPCGH